MLLASNPSSTPETKPSYVRCQIRQVPSSAPSKSTTLGIGGNPKITPWSSVTIH